MRFSLLSYLKQSSRSKSPFNYAQILSSHVVGGGMWKGRNPIPPRWWRVEIPRCEVIKDSGENHPQYPDGKNQKTTKVFSSKLTRPLCGTT